MFLDARTFGPDHVERAQICIFGSGPAGMTLAQKLVQGGSDVLLVEAGGMGYENWSQDLYKGDVIGDTYYDLSEARLRMFGGSSSHWGGRCIPLEAHDFEKNPGVPDTGWPIARTDLDPYLQEACDVVEIPNDFGTSQFTPKVRKTLFQYSAPTLFGEKYMALAETAPNLRVCLETALTDLVPEGEAIAQARVATHQASRWSIEADTFVLCMGGIENPRMLLWMDEQNNGALNGNRDVLGTYWMEHPHAFLAEMLLYTPEEGFFSNGDATFALNREVQHEEAILNAGLTLNKMAYDRGAKSMIADLLCVAPRLGERLFHGIGKTLVCGARLHSHWEQGPVRSNRVKLGETKDALGIPKTELYWRRNEHDINTIVETTRIFAEEMAMHDKGRVRLAEWIREGSLVPNSGAMIAGWHHMGGTRMSDDPSRGVVDRNLRVHGLGNLYVGGSSVFPTGGYANPTLTIVQMSLRLADHLKPRF